VHQQSGIHLVGLAFPERSGTLDVREQEGHRPRRSIGHTAVSLAGDLRALSVTPANVPVTCAAPSGAYGAIGSGSCRTRVGANLGESFSPASCRRR
jgi:hypothetical protein